MTIRWIKCQGDVWCQLTTVNVDHAHFNNMGGVYVIWHGGPNSHTVYVGQGNIRDCIKRHRTEPTELTEPKIQRFASLGLFVTWAAVQQEQRDGVERFLKEKLTPKVGEKWPDVPPIEVNLPW